MPMSAGGLSKLIEECGELLGACGKRLAFYYTDAHPDGGPSLTKRVEDEIADVLAACALVIELHELDRAAIDLRCVTKLSLFRAWEDDPDNNDMAVDRPAPK
jgi:NTP pyrophosphatase (non-canonical NTP hydrolase)